MVSLPSDYGGSRRAGGSLSATVTSTGFLPSPVEHEASHTRLRRRWQFCNMTGKLAYHARNISSGICWLPCRDGVIVQDSIVTVIGSC